MGRLGSKRLQWNTLRVILSLAGPTMLEELMQTAVQYIDTAMVGSLGTQATAAVGSTTTINWLIHGTVAALGIGFLSYIAKACGAGDQTRAAKASAQALLATVIAGIFFTALTLTLSPVVPVWMQVDEPLRDTAAQYFFILYASMPFRSASILLGTVLRAAGDTKTPMRVGLLVNAVNVLLNFLFIYPTRAVSLFSGTITLPGLGWGVAGAAAASSIAFALGGICITVALWKHPVVSPRGYSIRPDWQVLRPCMKVALPNMLQRFGTSLGYVAFASMINSLGEVSAAAHTIANTVESAFYIPGYGMQTAAATLSGNALGAGDRRKMKDLTIMILCIEVSLMVISGGLLLIFAPSMMGLFSGNSQVIALGAVVLRMVAVTEPIYGVSLVLEGIMQGTGRTVKPFIFNIIGMWGVRIIGTFLATQILDMGLVSAWVCMILHNLLLFALFLTYYLRGRWNPLNAKTV